MTTIAYRDGALASDSLATWGDARDGLITKTAKRGCVMAAICGQAANGQQMLDWFVSGMKGEVPVCTDKDDPAYLFLFHPDGWILTHGPNGWERSRDEFFAAGTGSSFAKGAMSAGACAEQAVEIAIKHDTKSGGPVRVLLADAVK